MRARIKRVGSGYFIRIPKILIDLKYYELGKEYKVEIKDEDEY